MYFVNYQYAKKKPMFNLISLIMPVLAFII